MENYSKVQFLEYLQKKKDLEGNLKIFNDIHLNMFSPKISKILIESLDSCSEYLAVFKKGLSNELSLLRDIDKPNQSQSELMKNIEKSIIKSVPPPHFFL
jgi:hypothetical protein